MIASKLSAKYQIVVPKELRKHLRLRPGQTVYLSLGKAKGEVRVQTTSQLDEVYGALKGAWGKDSSQYLADLRSQANLDRH